MKIDTLLAHAGLCADEKTGAISTPIYQTATFRHPALGKSTGYDYSRSGNPTRHVLETIMARLEEGNCGFAFSSGMAALTAVMMLFSSGDHLILSDDLYGGTYRLMEKVFRPLDIAVSYIDVSSESAIVDAIIPGRTRAILLETPTNPLMKIADLGLIVSIARRNGLMTIVDNTFMTPYFQRPIPLGIDLVVHSGTKYLGGHNDLLSGIVVTRTPELSERMALIQKTTGAVLGPYDSWLMLRGIKTLSVRLRQQEQSTLRIAEWLREHPLVRQVYYPGLPDHPGHGIHRKQASGYGAVLSFRVRDQRLVEQVINHVRVISFAESLGGVETLITYPAVQTHGDIPAEMRERIGVTDDLLRLSVGIEDTNDLLNDLKQAME
jgi:cystathionine gamma-synthase